MSAAGGHEVASPALPRSASASGDSASVEVASPQPRPTCMQRLHNIASYDTPLVVKIRNRKVFFLHVVVQVLILTYIGVYGLWLKKGYQRTDEARGSSRVSVDGVAWSNGSLPWEGPQAKPQLLIWDALDLRSPPLETDALFVTSHMWKTRNQTRGTCVAFDDSNACSETQPCVPLKMTAAGRQIGGVDSCYINYTDPQQPWPTPRGGFCMQFGWCPNEFEPPAAGSDIPQLHLLGVDNFTASVRLDVHYPALHQHLGLSAQWSLGEIAARAGWSWDKIYRSGALFALKSRWDCDFDKPHADSRCVPEIEFKRLDNPRSKLSSGFNFRSVEFLHAPVGRDLTKRYGFRLLILMEGVGAQADVVAALTSIGAGIGLLSVATLVADLISTKLLSAKRVITSAKYREIVVADAEQNMFLRALHLERIEAEKEEEAKRSRAASRANQAAASNNDGGGGFGATAAGSSSQSQPAAGGLGVDLHERLLHSSAASS